MYDRALSQREKCTTGVVHLNLSALGEITDREDEIPRVMSIDTSGSGVESKGSSEDAESTTGFGDLDVLGEFTDHEEHEGDRQEEEQAGQDEGRAKGTSEHDGGEDEPSHEVDTKRIVELAGGGTTESSEDTRAGNEDRAEREPEATIRGEGSSTEGVSTCELPHTSEELAETTDTEGHSDYNIGLSDMASLDVVKG